jgi:predicted AAA+ superfamily ATPase
VEDILKRIYIENIQLIGDKEIVERDIRIPETDHISVLSGIRRCGKTFRLYQECRMLDMKNILFLDFEDERLIQMNQLENYDVILDSYR